MPRVDLELWEELLDLGVNRVLRKAWPSSVVNDSVALDAIRSARARAFDQAAELVMERQPEYACEGDENDYPSSKELARVLRARAMDERAKMRAHHRGGKQRAG